MITFRFSIGHLAEGIQADRNIGMKMPISGSKRMAREKREGGLLIIGNRAITEIFHSGLTFVTFM